ncbi:DEAD/DEAH box helicase [Schaalia sp. ZJ1691]|uniref:DEAD/DEAH box helicase n=1 Tax=Schaalia sp. ZJ1691 TaxID=2709404 RepID=UPI0013EC753E|nr:DEAD/DEAH box helicase [Schaalia sp. ZJ1691]
MNDEFAASSSQEELFEQLPGEDPETQEEEADVSDDQQVDDDDLDDDVTDDDDVDDDADDDEESDDSVTFADLGLPKDLLDAVTDMGFVTPTPIQAEAIPALLDLHDVVGIAQTGTGKTAAFGLPLLAIADADEKDVQALVLAPTRELAMQSAQAIEDFAARSRGLDVVPVYGGSAYGPQIGALKKGAQIVVGTPGRVIDLIEKGALDLSAVRMLVLDEADEMLRMGFAEDVETIASSVPKDRLTALFSATMPAAIERVAATHLTDPVKIAVSEESSTVDTIHQTYAVVPYKHKIGALSRVLATRAQHIAEGEDDADAAIVFVRTRADVEEISLELAARGFRAAGISGDVAQTERERMVERLKSGSLDVLVATDVAARGLDVERISLVVNFDVPREPAAYVHRIGRTGRAGRTGRSLSFFTPREHSRLRRIEKLTGTPMEEVAIPSPAAVSEFRAKRALESLPVRIERGRLGMYRQLLNDFISQRLVTAPLGDESGQEEALVLVDDDERNAGDAMTEMSQASAEVTQGQRLSELMDIAAALMAQAVGDEGPEPRVEKDRRGKGRIRREEELDDSGEFIGASFEGGRDKDRPIKGGREGSRRRGGGRHVAGNGTRYRVEVGRKDRVKPGAIVGAIAGEGGVDGKDIGNIEIFPTFSLVEITGDLTDDQMRRIGKGQVQGRALRIRPDEGPGGRRAEREQRFDRSTEFKRSDDRRGREDRWSDRRSREREYQEEDQGRRRSVRSERWARETQKRREEYQGSTHSRGGKGESLRFDRSRGRHSGDRGRGERPSGGRSFGSRRSFGR